MIGGERECERRGERKKEKIQRERERKGRKKGKRENTNFPNGKRRSMDIFRASTDARKAASSSVIQLESGQ